MMNPITHKIGDPGYVLPGSDGHRQVIGASRAADILGHGFHDADYHWRLMTGKSKPEGHKKIFDRGHTMESVIIDLLEKEIGQRVTGRQLQFTDPTRPWLVCHVDGLLAEHFAVGSGERLYEGRGYVEVKAPGSRMASQYRDCGLGSNYVAQGQIAAHIAGLTWGRFVFLDYDQWELVPFDVPRSDEYLVPALQALDYFWDCVQKDVPPIELRTAVTEDLPQIGGEVELVSDAEASDLMEELVQMTLVKREADSEVERLKARFKATHEIGKYHRPGIGKVSRGVRQGRLTWQGQDLSDFVELAAERHGFDYDPEMFCKRGSDFEVINVYPDKEMTG